MLLKGKVAVILEAVARLELQLRRFFFVKEHMFIYAQEI